MFQIQKGQTIYCIVQSAYAEHISKRAGYEIAEVKDDKLRIRSVNGKLVWIPAYCFVSELSLIPSVKTIEIEAESWEAGEWNPEDDNTDVWVTLSDHTKWVASFFTYKNINTLAKKNHQTGESLSGKFFWASDMILVDQVTRASIDEVVRHLIEEEPWEFMELFRRMDGED